MKTTLLTAAAFLGGVLIVTAPALAKPDVPYQGFTWIGPIAVSAGQGQAYAVPQGWCLPMVSQRGQLLCNTHSNYPFMMGAADLGAYQVTLAEAGLAGMGNSIEMSFARAARVERVTTLDCAEQIGAAILNGDPRSATRCLPAPDGGTLIFRMDWIGSDGSFGGCVVANPDDSCWLSGSGTGPETLAKRGIRVIYREDVTRQ